MGTRPVKTGRIGSDRNHESSVDAGGLRIRSGKPLRPLALDATDLRIIAVLRANGRASNLEIAEQLSINPATVSVRLNRLDQLRAMRVVAVSDFSAHGLLVLAAVGVRVRGRSAYDVGQELCQFPEVLSVNIMVGAYDLELLVAFQDLAGISTFLVDHIGHVKGISEITSGIAADIVKFEFNIAPL